MLLELIAAVTAAVACAGLALLLRLLTRRRLPRWITPVAAGLGMLGMTISNEYAWFDRAALRLPTGATIAMTVEEQSWMRPWTQLWPYTKRFVAVDAAAARRHRDLPDQRLADLYFFSRWSPVNQAPMLFDCVGGRAALLIDGAEFSADGAVTNADWRPAPEDDPILRLVCGA